MSAVFLFKMEVAGFTFDDLLFWLTPHFPVVPLCPLLSRSLKTIDSAILLMGFDLGKFRPTVQTTHNFCWFSGIGFPAFATTESMGQRPGFVHRPASLARFRWSILHI
jgi:hypothetical protein